MNITKLGIIGLVILAFSLTTFGQKAAAQKADPTKPVHDAFDRLVDGIKTADAAKVMSVYENSPRILFFNNNGSVTSITFRLGRLSTLAGSFSARLSISSIRRPKTSSNRRI